MGCAVYTPLNIRRRIIVVSPVVSAWRLESAILDINMKNKKLLEAYRALLKANAVFLQEIRKAEQSNDQALAELMSLTGHKSVKAMVDRFQKLAGIRK